MEHLAIFFCFAFVVFLIGFGIVYIFILWRDDPFVIPVSILLFLCAGFTFYNTPISGQDYKYLDIDKYFVITNLNDGGYLVTNKYSLTSRKEYDARFINALVASRIYEFIGQPSQLYVLKQDKFNILGYCICTTYQLKY